MKYPIITAVPGGWSKWIAPRRSGYRLACCDCGLVHNMQFRVVDKQIQFRAQRNARATGQIRRHAL